MYLSASLPLYMYINNISSIFLSVSLPLYYIYIIYLTVCIALHCLAPIDLNLSILFLSTICQFIYNINLLFTIICLSLVVFISISVD